MKHWLSLAVLLLGVGFGAQPAMSQPTLKNLVIEQGSDIVSLDPQLEIDTATGRVTQNIYDSLFRVGPDGNPVPHLAVSYRLVDPLTWEINLRHGVKFHDGEDFNAEAVKFSIERSRDQSIKPRPRLAAYYTTFADVEVVDPYTVRIKTKEPDPIVIRRLTGLFGVMLPPKYIKKYGNDILKTKPVGTGPYKFVRWDKDESLVLQANDQYWGRKSGIERVTFKPVSEITTRIADLKLGRADIISDVPPDQIKSLRETANVSVKVMMSSRNIHIVFNPLNGGPLADRRVRVALTHAVDVDGLIKNILGGHGRRIATLFIPETAGFDPTVKPLSYDPALAKKMLAEAGYPKGFEVGFDVPSGRYVKIDEIAEAIAGQLAAVGVTAKIHRYEWGGFVKRWAARKFSGLAILGAGDEMFDADQLLTSRLITNANYGGFYSNPKLDKLILAGRKTTDVAARMKIYSDIQHIIQEDAPILPLYQQPNIYGIRSDRIQWKPTIDEKIDLDQITVVGH
ncbi:ABC transporter substrate-binding protein [Candidimonas nitroreducens]|uniref:Solute-binding protein family 5 domain-containing protein n=1 Tax=Candidimonas nitroreducens TaxID=683354 RepID=A0A225MXJ3_9BURK|nr:ABC transporter substrate-binding protein [Candidimonas nitroreducens]OWT65792.1 hypothetical protein CEY11_03425 [Candidimonas nitroreducens]